MRLEHARLLLRQTTLPVAQIALATGIVASMHFSKSQKRHFGVTSTSERMTPSVGPRLTAREQAALSCILMGMHTEGIALSLHVKPASVIIFRKRAYAKLGITSQPELFARCLRVLPRLPIEAQL
jgi:DNA-binding CsgD family transcriptional regulator